MIQKNQSKRNVAFPYQNLNQILRRLTHRIKNIYQKIKINAWVPGEPDNVGFTSSVVCRLAAAAVGWRWPGDDFFTPPGISSIGSEQHM